jgi:hypothetical protein
VFKTTKILYLKIVMSAAPSSSSILTESKGAGVKNRKTGPNFRKRRANGVCLDLTKDAINMCQTDIAKDLNRWLPANRTPRGASTSKQRTPRPSLQSLPKSSMLQFGFKPRYCISFAFIIVSDSEVEINRCCWDFYEPCSSASQLNSSGKRRFVLSSHILFRLTYCFVTCNNYCLY